MDRPSSGWRYAGRTDAAGHIYHLAVDPDYHGRGVGKRLVDECLDGLRRTGVKRVMILVDEKNGLGRKFWNDHGWEEQPGALSMGIDL